MELLSDDEMEAKAKVTTPPSSSSKKKTGMSFEDYKKKPEVAQKDKEKRLLRLGDLQHLCFQ
jgi:hypothetical protein